VSLDAAVAAAVEDALKRIVPDLVRAAVAEALATPGELKPLHAWMDCAPDTARMRLKRRGIKPEDIGGVRVGKSARFVYPASAIERLK
jgi:hypothetical protein